MSTQPEDKKKAANYYQGITAPGSPTYCGKRFPSWREYFPTIYGITGTNGYTYPRS